MLKLSLKEDVIQEQNDDHASNDVITAREENEEVTDEEQNSGVINLSINHQKDEALRQTAATYDSRQQESRRDVLSKAENEEVRPLGHSLGQKHARKKEI